MTIEQKFLLMLWNPLPQNCHVKKLNASNSSTKSSDHKVTMHFLLHLLLYQNEDEEPHGHSKYDGPSLQSALQLLNHNDPNFKFVTISYSKDHKENTALKSIDDVKSVGRAIAKSTTVENLKITGHRYRSIQFQKETNILLLLWEMKGNRSIRHVELQYLNFMDQFGEKVLNALEPFWGNNSPLEAFVMKCCPFRHDALRRLMGALISRDSPLDSFAMDECRIDDEAVKEITSSFNGNPKMTPRKLLLNSNAIGNIGCSFLSELIGNDKCKLEEISLIGNKSIGPTQFRLIASAAAGREVPLKKIDFFNHYISHTPDELQDLVEFLSAYPASVPNRVSFSCENFEVGRDVLHALGNMLARRSFPIESFYFRKNAMERDGVLSFLRAFLENPIATPKHITIVGGLIRQRFFGNLHLVLGPLLRSRLCSLEHLALISMGQTSDDEMIDIATSLDGNTTLKKLHIHYTIPTARVVDRLTTLLCDETTIMSTYNSNHTLNDLGFLTRFAPKLLKYLELNKYPDKGLVAIAKIIEVHFAHNIQLANFDSMKSNVLSQVVSFVNRGFHVWKEVKSDVECKGGEEKEIANNNLTVNFLMVRNITAFFEYAKPRWERQKTCADV